MTTFDACVLGVALLGLLLLWTHVMARPAHRARVLAPGWEPRLRNALRESLDVGDEPVLVDLWLGDLMVAPPLRERLARAVHGAVGVQLEDAILYRVRTYGDLVRAVARAMERAAEAAPVASVRSDSSPHAA